MNKKLMIAALILSFPLIAFSGQQQPGSGDPGMPRHGQRIDRLAQELGLSDDQKAKVQAIFDQQKGQFKALKEQRRAQLQSILTPEQMTKFDQMHQKRWQHHQDGGQGAGADADSAGSAGAAAGSQ